MNVTRVAESIADEGLRAKFVTVPELLNSWIGEHKKLTGSHILDFGCGEGMTALGLALNYGPGRIVGVDIMPDPERCLPLAKQYLGLNELPANLSLHRVSPGALHCETDRFDAIYSWSVFEHVDQRLLDATLNLIRSALKRDGLLLIQIAPLYYSAEGSHLAHKIREPWGHLLTQHSVFYEKLTAAVPDEHERRMLWSTYRTLNRITANELVEKVKRAKFEILRTYSTKDGTEPPKQLESIFQKEILVTNQIVLLARPFP